MSVHRPSTFHPASPRWPSGLEAGFSFPAACSGQTAAVPEARVGIVPCPARHARANSQDCLSRSEQECMSRSEKDGDAAGPARPIRSAGTDSQHRISPSEWPRWVGVRLTGQATSKLRCEVPGSRIPNRLDPLGGSLVTRRWHRGPWSGPRSRRVEAGFGVNFLLTLLRQDAAMPLATLGGRARPNRSARTDSHHRMAHSQWPKWVEIWLTELLRGRVRYAAPASHRRTRPCSLESSLSTCRPWHEPREVETGLAVTAALIHLGQRTAIAQATMGDRGGPDVQHPVSASGWPKPTGIRLTRSKRESALHRERRELGYDTQPGRRARGIAWRR